MKRKTLDRDVSRSCLGETSHRSIEVVGNDAILEAKHKIFLSHSGAQKEFVDHLCKALEDRFHYPFYDRRHESLPKGEQFLELIVRAAEQCEMLIVVVSDEYFMSKWPMIELSAFVQAHKLHHEPKSSSSGPKILPLFYGLSVDDLKDATKRKTWFGKWETLAKGDPGNRISVSDWKYALDVLRSFNGLPYDLQGIVAYEEEIVSYVCKSISPDIKWDDSHVQGKSTICKVIGEKIEGIIVSSKHNVKVFGLYGVGGIGKTTTCKTLCNELSSKYEGRVCHIEFPIKFPIAALSDSKEFFQKVLQDLTRRSVEVVQHLNDGHCKDILRKSLFKQRTFLAIDNVSDSHQSISLAKTFLELPYHTDSVVVVTARSPSVLELLGTNGDACLEMPDLREADAMRLFLHHAVGGKEFFEDEEKHDIMTCVRRCYFSKGAGQGYHYHPLALQSLGLQLGCHGENPSLWVKHLPRVRTFNGLSGGNPVFDILRSGFDLLSLRDQTLFMDVGCFCHRFKNFISLSSLCVAHKLDNDEITHKLEHLKRQGLLQDVDLRSGKVTMHDLYREFAKLEAKGSFNDNGDLTERMWFYNDNGDLTELKCKPKGGCWHKLIRLTIDYNGVGESRILDGIKWDYFSNVVVLRLWALGLKHGALNLEGLVCLRILDIDGLENIDGIEGLGELKNLTEFTWDFGNYSSFDVPTPIVGQLPSSLKVLKIYGTAGLVPDSLARCHNLVDLDLEMVTALSLHLRSCRSLERVSLGDIQKLQTLLGLAARPSCRLQVLEVSHCYDLVDIPGLDPLTGLKEFHIDINLSGSSGLTSLVELENFPALQVLDIRGCYQLMRLPDLSKSRNLKELNVGECSALELHERDIQMLSELPLLQVLRFEDDLCDKSEGQSFKLDLRRGKVLVHQSIKVSSSEVWKAGTWEERDLGPPPILIGKLGPFFVGKEYGMDSDETMLALSL